MKVSWCQQITLISQQNLRNLVPTVVNELLEPVLGVIEGVFVGKVEHNDPCLGECEVIIDNSSIPFLSGGVPELEVEGSVRMSDLFESIINTDGWFLRVELSINITNQKCTFSNS